MNRDCLPPKLKPRKRRAFADTEVPVHLATSYVHRSSNAAGTDSTTKQSRDASSDDRGRSLLAKPDISHAGSRPFVKLLSRGLSIDEVSKMHFI